MTCFSRKQNKFIEGSLGKNTICCTNESYVVLYDEMMTYTSLLLTENIVRPRLAVLKTDVRENQTRKTRGDHSYEYRTTENSDAYISTLAENTPKFLFSSDQTIQSMKNTNDSSRG